MGYCKQIIGSKCCLSPLETSAAEKVAEWLNDLKVQMNFDAVYNLTAEEETYYIPEARKVSRIFGIVEIKTGKLIGVTGLHEIDHVSRHAMLGIYIGDPDYRNNGYGTEAVKLILDFGFNMLNLNNIALFVIEFNKRAVKVYEKCGFKHAGVKRKSKIFGDEKYDMLMMDILYDEFKSVYVKKVLNELKENN